MKKLVMLLIIAVVAAFAMYPTIAESTKDIDAIIKSECEAGKVVMLELSSATCTTCKQMRPGMSAVTEKHGDKIHIEIIDVDARKSIGKKYNVTALPTQVFIAPDGEQYYYHQGYMSEDDIVAVMNQK